MSWAAHQFETYAVMAHLPKKMRGKVSYFAVYLGDFVPDFLAKFWVYEVPSDRRLAGIGPSRPSSTTNSWTVPP